LIAGSIYLVVTLIAPMVVDLKTLGGSDAPLLEIVKIGPLGIPPLFFSAIALFAVANGALINMIMASRIVYGMSNQGVVPKVFQRVLPNRRTPWVAIVFTTVLGVALIITGDLGVLADTTVMLLLIVFAVVNISVLVLRREEVSHEHFRAPTIAPVLGALVCLYLVTQNEQDIYFRAGIIAAIALVFWGINIFSPAERDDLEAEALSG
jgi:APA family basic amino acid/polyamine antiporter